MKKLLAIAVATAFTAAPMVATADTQAYGSVRYLLELGGTKALGDYGSRIGLKGSNAINNGLSMTHKIELGVDPAANTTLENRSSYIGIKGGFGEVRIGSDWTPIDNVGDISDVLQNGNIGDVDGDRLTSIKYLGKFGPVGVLASVVPKGNQANTKAQLGLTYTAGPIAAGVGFGSNVGDNTAMASLAYSGANYKVGFSHADDGSDDARNALMGSYSFGNAWVAAQYDKKGDDKNKHIDLGYKLGKGTKTFLQIKKSNDDKTTKHLGLRHDF
ncbi:MAG: porin [Cocleimonas sp.]|nr:porin [Cocleimonas sp.]